jgi:hypothetical protein
LPVVRGSAHRPVVIFVAFLKRVGIRIIVFGVVGLKRVLRAIFQIVV